MLDYTLHITYYLQGNSQEEYIQPWRIVYSFLWILVQLVSKSEQAQSIWFMFYIFYLFPMVRSFQQSLINVSQISDTYKTIFKLYYSYFKIKILYIDFKLNILLTDYKSSCFANFHRNINFIQFLQFLLKIKKPIIIRNFRNTNRIRFKKSRLQKLVLINHFR